MESGRKWVTNRYEQGLHIRSRHTLYLMSRRNMQNKVYGEDLFGEGVYGGLDGPEKKV